MLQRKNFQILVTVKKSYEKLFYLFHSDYHDAEPIANEWEVTDTTRKRKRWEKSDPSQWKREKIKLGNIKLKQPKTIN